MTGSRGDGTRGLAGIALGVLLMAALIAVPAALAILGVHGAGSP